MQQLEAVLWDMDGTLVDTEILWDKAIYGTMAALGAHLTEAQRLSTVGMCMEDLLTSLCDFAGSPGDPRVWTALSEGIVDRMGTLYRTEMTWRPGARELVEQLRRDGMPQALVTNTQRELTDLALDVIGGDVFAVSVCGDEVPSGKPYPDPYLRACELLSFSPSRCVVLEDSATGVAAGMAAGCPVIGVDGTGVLTPQTGYALWETLSDVTVLDLQRYVAHSSADVTQSQRSC